MGVSGGCSERVCRFTEERMEFAKKLHEPEDGCGTCGFWRDSLEDCTKCGRVRMQAVLTQRCCFGNLLDVVLLWHYLAVLLGTQTDCAALALGLAVVLLWHSN